MELFNLINPFSSSYHSIDGFLKLPRRKAIIIAIMTIGVGILTLPLLSLPAIAFFRKLVGSLNIPNKESANKTNLIALETLNVPTMPDVMPINVIIPRAGRFLNFSSTLRRSQQTWISLQDRAMSWDAKDADEKFKDLSARGIVKRVMKRHHLTITIVLIMIISLMRSKAILN